MFGPNRPQQKFIVITQNNLCSQQKNEYFVLILNNGALIFKGKFFNVSNWFGIAFYLAFNSCS